MSKQFEYYANCEFSNETESYWWVSDLTEGVSKIMVIQNKDLDFNPTYMQGKESELEFNEIPEEYEIHDYNEFVINELQREEIDQDLIVSFLLNNNLVIKSNSRFLGPLPDNRLWKVTACLPEEDLFAIRSHIYTKENLEWITIKKLNFKEFGEHFEIISVGENFNVIDVRCPVVSKERVEEVISSIEK